MCSGAAVWVELASLLLASILSFVSLIGVWFRWDVGGWDNNALELLSSANQNSTLEVYLFQVCTLQGNQCETIHAVHEVSEEWEGMQVLAACAFMLNFAALTALLHECSVNYRLAVDLPCCAIRLPALILGSASVMAIAAVCIGVDERTRYGGSPTTDYGFSAEALAAALDLVLMCAMVCAMDAPTMPQLHQHQHQQVVGAATPAPGDGGLAAGSPPAMI